MRLGDLKILTLKTLENCDSDSIVYENLDELEESAIEGEYLKTFNTSLNKAFSRLTSLKLVPFKVVEIDSTTNSLRKSEKTVRYDLNSIASDVYSIEQIEYENNSGEIDVCDFKQTGNILTLETITEGKYIITYAPRLPFIPEGTSNSYSITENTKLKDDLLNIIPYYIKGDIYEGDDSSLAQNSRNLFEAYASEFTNEGVKLQQNQIKSRWY